MIAIKKCPKSSKLLPVQSEESADFIDMLYKSIIVAGTHKAASIKIAEGAKIVENVQRDVNIALINELFQNLSLRWKLILTQSLKQHPQNGIS